MINLHKFRLLKLLKYYSIVLILAFFMACSEEEQDYATFSIIELKQDIPLFENGEDSSRYHIEFKLPQLIFYQNQNVRDEVNFKLNTYFFNEEGIVGTNDPQKNFDRLVASLTEWYQKEVPYAKNEYSNNKGLLNYELLKGGSIIYNKNKILTVACEIYSYTGGAHGLNSIEYIHFDMNTGQRFTLDILFDENEKQQLLKLVSAKCEEMKKEKESEVFEESSIESCDNFYFDENNFYFVFNPYEIGPYSAGYISIQIPIGDLKPLIKKNIHPGFIKN